MNDISSNTKLQNPTSVNSTNKESNENLFLIGFMGAGKSTIARYLKEKAGFDLIEMDSQIEQDTNMKISEIFDQFGEEHFRKLETDLISEISPNQGYVISCGGGVAMSQVNVKAMKKAGKVIILNARPETIYERVKDNHHRTLLENNKTVEYITQLIEKRRPYYLAAADQIVETDNKDVEMICQEILKI